MTFKDEAGEFWSLVPETESKKSIMCVLIIKDSKILGWDKYSRATLEGPKF